jgi:phage terminase large subunit
MMGLMKMSEIQIDALNFNAVYLPYAKSNTRIQIYYGGSSSGKSVFVAGRVATDALAGRNTLVLRNVAKTLKGSCWNEIVKAIDRLGLRQWFHISKSELLITALNNGAQIMFAGLDDVEKIKSITPAVGVLTDIWIEEATEIEREDYKQLQKRLRGLCEHSKRITLTFNPIYKEHWIYTEFYGKWDDTKTSYRGKGISILKTTYKDNRFLTRADREALENETDEYYNNVYTLGNWGVLGDVIFRNWTCEDLTEVKKHADKLLFGLDFGFSSDPAAVVKVLYYRPKKTIYILDEIYERGLTNTALAIILKPFAGHNYITCDSAEPKSIVELQENGINAEEAVKGPDSVIYGIQWLQGCRIVVDVRCQHTKNELQLYQWKKDKDGNSMRKPEDKNNHLIDALRYAMEDESLQKTGYILD